jgi:hypothetical protein
MVACRAPRCSGTRAQDKARYLGFHRQAGQGQGAVSRRRWARAADAFYAYGYLAGSKARDRTRFNILFEENGTYGFRRHLFGLKWLALAANAAVVIVTSCLLPGRRRANGRGADDRRHSCLLHRDDGATARLSLWRSPRTNHGDKRAGKVSAIEVR